MLAKSLTRTALLLTLLLPAAFADSVNQFNQLVMFGDSLSDTGNAAIATGGLAPGPNYAPGRFTDGSLTSPATKGPFGLWVDQLSARIGIPDPQPFLAGGTDYAVASAKTGSNLLDGVSDQLGYFAKANPGGAPSNALYAIWAGSNDLYFGGNTPIAAADSLEANIKALAAGGGKTFLWVNLPPLGSTPLGMISGQVAALNGAVALFNAEWATDIAALRGLGINVIGVDVNSLFTKVSQNPSAYGFSDITDPAQGVSGIDPNTYLFWDMEHPTTAGHALVANLAYNDLVASPEPASLLFTALGLAGMLLVTRIRVLRRNAGHPAGR